ncbi:Imm49 family immunity protein [uncultured Xylophilus sp.]|uniref:Imm49 family immunity protein n=1 Tax=uncultured Xylophilus sp. TaxID=296832 RepID=UPI0025E42618|nr:Imm49 family immunity protein [uncultured Xylophilus sp.]
MKFLDQRGELLRQGLLHVKGHSDAQLDRSPEERSEYLIAYGLGSRSNCIRSLQSVHEARSIYRWFGEADIRGFKENCYVVSKLMCINAIEQGVGWAAEHDFFWFLLSDQDDLLRWFGAIEPSKTWLSNALNPNDHLFRHYQMSLAVRGDWTALGDRAEQQLAKDPPKLKKCMVDQRFYLALSQGDKAGMVDALTELTSPAMAKKRNDQLEFGFTHFFIGTHATMYAKLAWRHGHQIEIDTPYIPREWLPIQPLDHYEDPYPFMREYRNDALPPPRSGRAGKTQVEPPSVSAARK